MDIQKEREAFDEWHYNQYLLENPNIDTSSAKYIYDYAHKNVLVWQIRESHFTAWQAAKANTIPEGFVLVPKEPTSEMLYCGYAAPDNLAAKYKAMIEVAQEQSHDLFN